MAIAKVNTTETCQECKHRQLPDGKHPQRGWCGNDKSPYSNGYIYKGDSCDEFESLKPKKKAKKKGEDDKVNNSKSRY